MYLPSPQSLLLTYTRRLGTPTQKMPHFLRQKTTNIITSYSAL